ncbi:MAG: phosphatase PAP2 family protein [Streptosporangiaceae bacterium]
MAAAFVLACAVVVAVLGALFAGQSQPDRLDAAVGHWLRSSIGTHPAPLHVLANFGGPPLVTALTVVLVLAAMAARRWRGAVLPAVAVPLAAALTELALKPLFGRTIGGALSYPSGHATSDFALATVAAILFAGPARPRIPAFARRLLLLGAFLFAAVVAVAMVGLWYHYFTDIIGGAAVGSGTVVLTALVLTALPVPRPADRSACADHRWAPLLRRHWL